MNDNVDQAPNMTMSLSELLEFAKTAFDARLSTLDLENKLLIVQSDDLSENMLTSLQQGLKKQGSKVLGVVGLANEVTLTTLSVEELETMLEQARKNRDAGA